MLLSFAQFERELASERVRDKVAASRKKGKWTGGSVPLGFVAKDKKLIINKAEAETVRTIFQLYLELKSSGKLIAELDRRKIVTKRRNTKVKKYNGGIPFTYGPLAHFLKNRIYIGEVHHGGKWFKGEHEAILDRQTFEQVQDLLKSNRIIRRIKHSKSGALLKGKLFDDKGNRMGPSFSSKNGVRYRFYVSTALRGRNHNAGSVKRISAPEIESFVEAAVRNELDVPGTETEVISERIERVVLRNDLVCITLNSGDQAITASRTVDLPWMRAKAADTHVQPVYTDRKPDQKLLEAVVRARAWLADLTTGRFSSIEELATSSKLNPKVVRLALRLAFLSPCTTAAILTGGQHANLKLAEIPKLLSLHWLAHRQILRPLWS